MGETCDWLIGDFWHGVASIACRPSIPEDAVGSLRPLAGGTHPGVVRLRRPDVRFSYGGLSLDRSRRRDICHEFYRERSRQRLRGRVHDRSSPCPYSTPFHVGLTANRIPRPRHAFAGALDVVSHDGNQEVAAAGAASSNGMAFYVTELDDQGKNTKSWIFSLSTEYSRSFAFSHNVGVMHSFPDQRHLAIGFSFVGTAQPPGLAALENPGTSTGESALQCLCEAHAQYDACFRLVRCSWWALQDRFTERRASLVPHDW